MNYFRTGMSKHLAEWRQRNAEAQLRRRARDLALERFSQLHRFWYLSFFDRFFLERFTPDSLASIGPEGLAREWSRQFRYRDERQRAIDIRQLTPVVEHYLCLLESAYAELLLERPLAERPRDNAGALDCPEALAK